MCVYLNLPSIKVLSPNKGIFTADFVCVLNENIAPSKYLLWELPLLMLVA